HDNQMSYAEFVWFLLSEEDKRHPRAIEYWFRCMDLDGDGALSMYELEYFYSEQVKRMVAAGIEALPFTDCLCQVSLGSDALHHFGALTPIQLITSADDWPGQSAGPTEDHTE